MFPHALLKTVKFRDAPGPLEIVKQIDTLLRKLPEIYSAPKNLAIKLARYNHNNSAV